MPTQSYQTQHTGQFTTGEPSPLEVDRWLNAEEAGQYLGYSAWSMRKFAQRKLIKHARGPGHNSGYRFRRQWLDEFLESRAIAPKAARGRVLADSVATSSRPAPPRETIPMDPQLAAAVERAKLRQAKHAAREGGSR